VFAGSVIEEIDIPPPRCEAHVEGKLTA